MYFNWISRSHINFDKKNLKYLKWFSIVLQKKQVESKSSFRLTLFCFVFCWLAVEKNKSRFVWTLDEFVYFPHTSGLRLNSNNAERALFWYFNFHALPQNKRLNLSWWWLKMSRFSCPTFWVVLSLSLLSCAYFTILRHVISKFILYDTSTFMLNHRTNDRTWWWY